MSTALLLSARLARWLLVAALASLLGACAALPPRGEVEASTAWPDSGQTTLARIAGASRPSGETAPSGFLALPTGEFAYDARMALARRAERTLDLQCYHLHRDQAGLAMLRALRDAAGRGVRVRLLVDDLHAADIADLLADLALHERVQVRLFNPLPLRRGPPLLRLLLSRGEFARHHHRMHNKLFIADNTMAIYGGRNIADEYFMGHRDANFIDLDLLSTGAVVHALSAVFDRYWNSDPAWPVQRLEPGADAAPQRFDTAVRDAAPAMAAYRLDPLRQSAVSEQLQAGRLTLVHADAAVFADPPAKAAETAPGRQPTAAMAGMLAALAGARQSVTIISPYFLPGEVGMPMLRAAAQAGVRTVVFTNSLGTTDEPLVHQRYSRYRTEMLQLGVQLYELGATLTRRSRSFGAFGHSNPRLHAKVAVVDQRQVLVGSVNLDARSAIANTEMSVVIDSPALAAGVARLMGGEALASVYQLRLQPDGKTIEWLSSDGAGGTSVGTVEPDDHPWLRLKRWLQSLLVAEQLL